MTRSFLAKPDPKLDLVLERDVDVPRELVWAAYTQPEHLKKWFCPLPWTVAECEIDLRPGGLFRTVFRSPEGQLFPNDGCYLEVIPNERLVWTDTMLAGYRPAPEPFFTAVITMEARGKGTHYKAVAMHGNADVRKRHEEMGFYEGWGKTIDQLVELAKKM